MADIPLINNLKVGSVDTIVILYTSPVDGLGTIISALTVSNSSATSVSYKAYIVDATGTIIDPVVPLKIVVKDKFDSAPAMINQVVPAGGTIRAENSAANTLNFYATGREQTT